MMKPTLLLLAAFFAAVAPARADILEGNVFGPTGQPLVGVDIDVFDQVTGQKLVTPNDDTGVGGSFSVVVPPGLYRVGFDPFGLPGPTLAPKQIFDVLVEGGGHDLDDIFLEFGAVVTGTVLGPGSAPVAGVDLDLEDSSTGIKAYTPGDNTDASGNFSFAVELGNYFVEVEPPVSTRLLAQRSGPVNVNGNLSLGTFVLVAGVWLSGTVTGPGSGPVPFVDVDAFDASTSIEIPLAADPTSSTGAYIAVVPTGTIDVVFEPPSNSPFLPLTVPDVAIAGDTVLDAVLNLAGTDPNPTPLALGNSFVGALAGMTEVDEATFESIAGVALSLKLSFDPPGSMADVAVQVPSGGMLSLAGFRKESSNKVQVKSVPLPETGTYTLIVYSRAGAAATYTLQTKGKVPSTLKKVSTFGTVGAPGQVVDVPFLAFGGSLLTATVKTAGVLDPEVVDLLDPLGASVPLAGFLTVVPGSSAKITQAPLPLTGSYTLRVGGAGGSTGDFTANLKVKAPKFAKLVVPES
jgi:hypothetical protein